MTIKMRNPIYRVSDVPYGEPDEEQPQVDQRCCARVGCGTKLLRSAVKDGRMYCFAHEDTAGALASAVRFGAPGAWRDAMLAMIPAGGITTNKLRHMTGLSGNTLKYRLRVLRGEGKIRRVQAGKHQHFTYYPRLEGCDD